MKNHEGKVLISSLVYCKLAILALFTCTSRSIFSSFVYLFLVLFWNLFARSCSVADLHTQHLSWDNDCIAIDMSKHKGDQSGDKIIPKHV